MIYIHGRLAALTARRLSFCAVSIIGRRHGAFNRHRRVLFLGLSISVFLVSAGQQMPSSLEVEEAHGVVTPPALQGGFAESEISLAGFAPRHSSRQVFFKRFNKQIKAKNKTSCIHLAFLNE